LQKLRFFQNYSASALRKNKEDLRQCGQGVKVKFMQSFIDSPLKLCYQSQC